MNTTTIDPATAGYTPLDAPLFPTHDDPVFTDLQWESLLSLCDVVIPAVTADTTPNKQQHQKRISANEYDSILKSISQYLDSPDAAQTTRQYLEENVSSNPLFKEALRRAFSLHVPQDSKNGLSLILTALK